MPNDIIAQRELDRVATQTDDSLLDTNPPVVEEAPVTTEFNPIAGRENVKHIDPNGVGFLSNVAHEIENGLGNNLANMVTDYANAQPDSAELDLSMHDKALAMTEKFGWDTNMMDEILLESESPEEVERRATRIFEQQAYMASLENTGMGQQLIAGFAGFVGDPINLIPGGVVLKAGAATAKLMPKLTNALTKTTLGKTGTFAAMGATEEALRNYPRLMNDPTYSYDMYKIDIAIGAGFGGGLAAIVPVAGLGLNKIAAGVRKAGDKYKTSLEARMTVNSLTDTLRVTKNPKARAAVQEAIDAAVGKEAKATAEKVAKVERAQTQVNESKVNIKARDLEAEVKLKLDEGEFEVDEIIKEFADELKETSPTFAKIAEAIATRIKRAADKLDGESPQSMGAAKRKTTPRTVAEDLAADHEIARKALDDIDRAFDAAAGTAKAAKDFKAEDALNFMRNAAKRAVIEKAKINGVKLKGKKLSHIETSAIVGSKFKRYQKALNEVDNELNAALKAAGVTDRNVVSTAFHKALFAAGTSVKKLNKDLINNPELGKRIEVKLDEHFEELIDNLYSSTNKADPKLYEALFGAYNKIRADTQWAVMASKERRPEQIALDPQWAMMSREFTDSMGNDLNVLDEIYNGTRTGGKGEGLKSDAVQNVASKVGRHQFGPVARSYAGDLAASKTPLAQWAALHIFELPGGTGGKLARNETAAISMEMFEAAAVHPVNVAWDKATRIEAAKMGLNMFDSAVMRHSSASADVNANQLGRKVQLEMNARQMGLKSDAEPHIKAYADELEKAYDGLYKVQFDNGVEGITGTNKLKSYMSQRWSEKRIMDSTIGKEGLDKIIVNALRSRNPEATTRELKAQAKSISSRIDENINKRDGSRHQNIVTDGDYINKRTLHMDLSAEVEIGGTRYSVLDFMSNDVTSDLNKYAKKTSATAAISKASGGRLNSADAISGFIHAVGAESQALGQHVDVGTMTDSFKLMMGEPIKNFSPNARKIRDAVALSGMNGLGESQLAELGLAMNRGTAALFAANQVLDRVAGKYNKFDGLILRPEQAANTALLKEMQSVSTLYDQMHNLARQNVHFDDSFHGESTSSTMAALNKVVDMGTGGKYRPVLQHIQTKHTGYGSIRTMQEQVAMAGLMHDVGRKIMGKASSTSDARLADIGIPMDMIKRKVANGTIELDDLGNIKTLGLETWSTKEQHTLGVALRRHSAQQVQVGFAGEASALMQNPWVAFMLQFKSYPNIAAEKQQMRNVMFADKEAAMGVALNGASSMAARVIRYQSLALALPENKREKYLSDRYEDLGHDTLQYMGGVGTLVNTYDMATEPSRNILPPVVSWANNYRKAAMNATDGVTQRDIGNMASAVPLGTIAQANLITGIIREMMQKKQAPGQLADAVRGGEKEMNTLLNNVSTDRFERPARNRGN